MYLTPASWDEGPGCIGTHPVVAQLVTDAAVLRAPATVTITADDGRGTVSGSLRVEAPGWDVSGAFDALTQCEAIDRSGP